MKIECNVKQITSTNGRDVKEALDIYHDEVPSNIRTNENEILEYLSGKHVSDNRRMLFYILYCNDTVIGYAEIAVLKKSKAFFVDYFILSERYKNNAYFFMCYSLLVSELSKQYHDYKYIIVEYYLGYSASSGGAYFGKKCLSLENYKIIDKKYIQPALNANDPDSIVECQLLIKETSVQSSLEQLSAQKYISILEDIYFNHYIEWFSHFFSSEEQASYVAEVEKFLLQSRKRCGNKPVNLQNYTYVNCKYYTPAKCEMAINRPFHVPQKHRRLVYLLSLVALFISANLISFLIYLFFSRVLKFEDSIINIIFPLVTEIILFFGARLTIRFRM